MELKELVYNLELDSKYLAEECGNLKMRIKGLAKEISEQLYVSDMKYSAEKLSKLVAELEVLTTNLKVKEEIIKGLKSNL